VQKFKRQEVQAPRSSVARKALRPEMVCSGPERFLLLVLRPVLAGFWPERSPPPALRPEMAVFGPERE